MRQLIMILAIVQLTGCAAMEHQRIRAEQASQQSQLNLPDYAGVNNRNHPITDFAHGAAWWIGSDAAKKAINRAID